MSKTKEAPKKTVCAVRPFGNVIVIEPFQAVGTIYIPTGSDAGPTAKGTVVAVGPGTFSVDGVRLPSDVEVGEFVLYRSGPQLVEIEHEGESYVAVPENYLVVGL